MSEIEIPLDQSTFLEDCFLIMKSSDFLSKMCVLTKRDEYREYEIAKYIAKYKMDTN
jgi:hypothetical protein